MSTITASTTTTTAYTVAADTTGALVFQTGASSTVAMTIDGSQYTTLPALADPTAPTAGNLKTYAKTIGGGYTAPAFLNATNAAVQLQPAFANKRIGTSTVAGSGSSSLTNIGMRVPNPNSGASGTFATTNMFTRVFRVVASSTATAGTLGYFTTVVAEYTLGVPGTPNYAGFYLSTKFGIADAVASPRTFVGMSSSTSTPTNVEPSTLTNSIGVGQGAADTNLKIYYGGSAAQTPIDLGVNFPTNTNSVDWYELILYAPPSSNNTVYYQVTRLNTGNVATGTLTGTAGTTLPSNTTALAYRAWRSNNATASIVNIAQGNIYIETDY